MEILEGSGVGGESEVLDDVAADEVADGGYGAVPAGGAAGEGFCEGEIGGGGGGGGEGGDGAG